MIPALRRKTKKRNPILEFLFFPILQIVPESAHAPKHPE